MVNFNGNLILNSKAFLNIENRAFKFGDALFETLKVERFKIQFIEDHYFRLMASMRMLRMKIPMHFTIDFLENEIVKTIKGNDLESARVRLTIYRNNGGLYAPTSNEISYLIEVTILNVPAKDTYTIDVFKDYFIYSGLLSSIKTTNKITNVLAGIYASENGLDNCILLNERKYIAEAINGNIFTVEGNVLKTPATEEGCIKGVIRKKIIEIVSKNEKYSLIETAISPFELQKSDEVFITNAIVGIQSVTHYKKKIFSNTVAKELIKALASLI
jgi:branched-chain amino acid aminotransferase